MSEWIPFPLFPPRCSSNTACWVICTDCAASSNFWKLCTSKIHGRIVDTSRPARNILASVGSPWSLASACIPSYSLRLCCLAYTNRCVVRSPPRFYSFSSHTFTIPPWPYIYWIYCTTQLPIWLVWSPCHRAIWYFSSYSPMCHW